MENSIERLNSEKLTQGLKMASHFVHTMQPKLQNNEIKLQTTKYPHQEIC